MNRFTRFAAGSLATLALLSAGPLSASAATGPPLGSAIHFVALSGTGMTCTASTVNGNVGSLVGVTHDTTCHIHGNIVVGAAASGPFSDFTTAYGILQGKTCPAANHLSGQLGGRTLTPGVYCFDTTALLTTGILTLKGPSSGTWVIQTGTGLTTATSQVVMSSGGQACNVYWVVGSKATIGNGTRFQGNILAGTAVTFTGAKSSLVGRALAKAEVTMTGANLRRPSNWDTATCRRTP